MTYGLITKIGAAVTDTTLPQLMLSENEILVPGSLVLIDPMDTVDPWASGVPASGALLPNLAWAHSPIADAAPGLDQYSAHKLQFVNQAQAADAIFERTTKGGIHGIYSLVNNTNDNRGASLNLPTAILEYLYANPTNDIYFDMCLRVTRASPGDFSRATTIVRVSNGGHFLFYFERARIEPETGTLIAQSKKKPDGTTATMNTTNIIRLSVGVTGWNGANPTSASDIRPQLALWGNIGQLSSIGKNKGQSYVLYGAYMEDLTVSGRTFATVDAARQAQFVADFEAGGRFDADTFTDPATFA